MDCRVKSAFTRVFRRAMPSNDETVSVACHNLVENKMAYWLLKTEPETFSWDDQVKRGAKGEPWTGVRNFIARGHLKAMKKGEHAFFYHTGEEKQVVGIVEVIRESYHDPTDEKGVFLAVDVKAVKPFSKPVTLAAVKAERRLKEMALAKYPRLSVQPVTAQDWKIVCALGGVKD